MAGVPTAYSEAELSTLMVLQLSQVAGVLGWTTATAEVADAVIDTLLAYFGEAGTDSVIANATDIMKLRVLARRAIWRAAVAALTTHYTFSTDSQSFNRTDMMKYASAMLEKAEADASAFDTSTMPAVGVSTIFYPADPYQYLPDDERVA